MWIPKYEEKKHFCHKCRNALVFDVKPQRRDTCTHCGADLICCKNCEHWDPSAHNQCKEHITEYIPDRESANHCTFFTFRNGEAPDNDAERKAKAKLASLFGPKK